MPESCPLCDASLPSLYHLSLHLTAHHTDSGLTLLSSLQMGCAGIKCWCGHWFDLHVNWTRHLAAHHGPTTHYLEVVLGVFKPLESQP